MAEGFLSTIWYRVAELQPRLRPHVTVHRHRYRGRAWYVLYDPVSGRVHRFTPAAWLVIGQLDGQRTVDAVWRDLAESHETHAPGQDEVIQLLSRLHQNDLIQYRGSPDVADLLERHGRQARQVVKQNLLNPMSFRVRLWDPDRFLRRTLPLVRWLTGWFGLALWVVVVAVGLAVAAVNWNPLTRDFTAQLLGMQNLLITLVSYPLLKTCHEFAHGYLARSRGAEVREMGIMFLVLFPVPYVDASAATALRSKWDRAAVAAGGILIELFVAAVAVMVWAAAEPGLVRAIAFNLVMIGSLSTLIVNGNPLLKFDGYYVLTDLIEMPNLAQRASRWWGHIIQRYIFGARQLKPDPATPGERVWFAIYGPAAWVYRLMVMVGIAILISQRLFFVGVLLGLWSLFTSMVLPIFKGLRHVVTAPALRKVRRRAMGWTFGTIGVGLALLLLVPLPLRTGAEGVIWLPDAAVVRAGTGGFVSELPVTTGARVAAGTVLAALDAPTQAAQLAVLQARVAEARQRLTQAEAEDRHQIAAARIQLDQAGAQLARELDRASRLQLTAPMAGLFTPVQPAQDLPGRFLPEGEVLGHVLPDHASIARVVVGQDDIALIRERYTGAELALPGAVAARYPATLARAVPQASGLLPSPALGTMGGGPFLTDPSDTEGLRVLEQVFVFDLTLPPELTTAPFGARVLVRFDLGHEPAAGQIWRRVRQLFLRQFDA